MATEKQIAANRLNSLNSSGPGNTDATKFNRTTHGLRGSRVVLPKESQQMYDAMAHTLYIYFKPLGTYEHSLVKRIADKGWELERIEGLKSDVMVNNGYRDLMEKELQLLSRYETSADRNRIRSRKELYEVQKVRGKNFKADKEHEETITCLCPCCNIPLPEMDEQTSVGDDPCVDPSQDELPFIMGQDGGPHCEYRPSHGESAVHNLEKLAINKMKRELTPHGEKPLDHYIEHIADCTLAIEDDECRDASPLPQSPTEDEGCRGGSRTAPNVGADPRVGPSPNESLSVGADPRVGPSPSTEGEHDAFFNMLDELQKTLSPKQFAKATRKLQHDARYKLWQKRFLKLSKRNASSGNGKP